MMRSREPFFYIFPQGFVVCEEEKKGQVSYTALGIYPYLLEGFGYLTIGHWVKDGYVCIVLNPVSTKELVAVVGKPEYSEEMKGQVLRKNLYGENFELALTNTVRAFNTTLALTQIFRRTSPLNNILTTVPQTHTPPRYLKDPLHLSLAA